MKNGMDCQCCLAGSSKTPPRIFIFSIVLGAEYSSYVEFIAADALTFSGYIISVLASVNDKEGAFELLQTPFSKI